MSDELIKERKKIRKKISALEWEITEKRRLSRALCWRELELTKEIVTQEMEKEK